MAKHITVECTCPDCGTKIGVRVTPSMAAAALRAGRTTYDSGKLSEAGKRGAAKRWGKKTK